MTLVTKPRLVNGSEHTQRLLCLAIKDSLKVARGLVVNQQSSKFLLLKLISSVMGSGPNTRQGSLDQLTNINLLSSVSKAIATF